MERDQLKFQAKLTISYKEKIFGPGVARLLELVEETSSLNKACKEMGMSYSKAWKILSAVQNNLGLTLLEGTAGGKGGGGSALTEEGRDFLNRYQAFQEEANTALDQIFQKHFHT